jgi:HK97 family phage portal protein
MAVSIKIGSKEYFIRSPLGKKEWNFIPSGIGGTNRLSDAWLAAYGKESQDIDTTTTDGQMTAYTSCPPVSTIISKKAQAMNRCDFVYANESGTQRNLGQASFITQLLKNPNPLQSFDAFMTMAYTMNQLFGRAYFFAVKPVGMGFDSVQELYVIPNTEIEVHDTTDGHFKVPISYDVQFGDHAYTIPADSIYYWDDFNVDFTMDIQYTKGMSRLYPLGHVVTANASAYNANNTLLTNYGAIGIISSGKEIQGSSAPMTSEERKEIQKQFKEKYGILKGKWDTILSTIPLNYQTISKPIKDLMLMETIQDTTRVISEAYNYPMHLLGFNEGTTYANVSEARRSLYEEAIIPEAESFCSFINSELGIEGETYCLRPSFKKVLV